MSKRVVTPRKIMAAGMRGKRTRTERNDPIVAANIRRYRMAAGLSQTQLGNILGLTFQQIQKYEKGTNACSPGYLRMIARACKVTVPHLFADLPTVGGETVPLTESWAYAALVAAGKTNDPRVQRALVALLEEIAKHKASQ